MNKVLLVLIAFMLSFSGYSQSAKDYFVSASEKAKHDDYKGTIADLAKIISIDSLYLRASLHYLDNKVRKENSGTVSMANYTIIVTIDPKKTGVKLLKKSAESQSKESENANKEYTKAVKNKNGKADINLLKEKADMALSKYNETMETIKSVSGSIEIDPEAAGYYNLKILAQKQLDRFAGNFTYILLKNPDFIDAVRRDNEQ